MDYDEVTIIENIIALMQRVPLKGSEAPTFQQCVAYLNEQHKALTQQAAQDNGAAMLRQIAPGIQGPIADDTPKTEEQQ